MLNLFTIMAAITVLVVLALTGFTYVQGRSVAEATGRALSRELTAKVAHRIETLFSPAAVLAEMSSSLPEIATPPDLLIHSAGWYIMQALESYPTLYSGYMGYADGRFYQLIAVPERAASPREDLVRARTVRLTHGAPPETRFIHRVILPRPGGDRLQIWTFLDRDRVMLGSRIDAHPRYDPRARPWYAEARATKATVMTDIYTFASLGLPGLTLARPFDGNVPGVLGIDLTLASIADFLAAQTLSPNGRLLVATSDGQVIAYRNRDGLRTGAEYVRGRPLSLGDLGDPAIARALVTDAATTDVHVVEMAGTQEPMLVRRMDVAMPGTRDLAVAMAAPLSDFTGPVDTLIANSLLFAAAVALLGIPLTWLVARRMSRALALLAEDAGRVQRLDLDHGVRVQTIVREIHDLARAHTMMKESLRTFGLYVPKDLVRQILAAGGSAEPGGQRRELTLLFTDIADFTTIAETLPPEDLMVRTSLYFEEMTAAINAHGGVIDKFIGDAVMALWNAPTPTDDHVTLGCLGALAARDRVAAFNAGLAARGVPVFRTRFGLHVGEAVVGNLGSSDRMDYSAIGAAVNTASRIEGLNKVYGTEILVSEPVATRAAGRFVLREIDHVVPKGAHAPIRVFELMGVHPDADLAASGRADPAAVVDAATVDYARRWAEAQDRLRRAGDWAGARDAFAAMAAARPDDTLAASFRDLADGLARDPEAAVHWSEVRRMEGK
ncbi:adenylate/guanylate cyclase domain-containing protein [Roseospira goensis]|uniref:Adenylate cyclase n=1 Tax=Roseospira goensis TaxID=391922 RepID=A0A7W6RWE6_9PROT|nr:adenylate cyclase [Roseospira goensis]